MLSVLKTESDAAAFPLPPVRTDLRVRIDFDFPEDARPVVPASRDCASPVEVTSIRIELDREDADDLYDVEIYAWGYPLTRKLERSQRAGHAALYGYHDCAVQWDLRRACVVAALASQGIPLDQVRGGVPTWQDLQDHKAERRREYAERVAAEHEAKAAKATERAV